MPWRLDATRPGFERAFRRLLSLKREASVEVDRVVGRILDDVKRRGDAAIIAYTKRFDRLALAPKTLRLSRREIAAGAAKAPKAQRRALEFAAKRIAAYHRRQKPADADWRDASGARLGWRWTALDAVGLYVPGGKASYPSSFLMNAIPARVAGVRRIAITMPTPGGETNPLVLAAAELLGLDEIYRIGGAQAVGALAHGTKTIAAVDKIVGPGNAYVAAAKRRVYGVVGIDSIAGPSEVLVVSDRGSDPRLIAVDLLSQAEHDEAAQSILITDDAAFADRVAGEVETALRELPRRKVAAASWRANGAIILVKSLADAPALIDRVAPEHLVIATDRPDALAREVRHAGAIFLGRDTPEAVGDYVAGPNHVLPTARSARFSSGLSVLDFLKRTTFLGLDRKALAKVGPAAVVLADAEGLDAHALSVALRLKGR